MIKSHSLLHKDFSTKWYKKWAKSLKQDKQHLENHDLFANKFWQNAIIAQALWERGVIAEGTRGVGFGVGQERLPALFASLGASVTATDQDFKTKKAGHWAKYELATSTQSLNKIGICNKKIFDEKVDYQPVDMTKIKSNLFGKYNFLWSNCALGHLGSIPAGLNFIEQSLNCLVPGGWAVHTTELNILSNKETVEGGSTVIFRLRDLYALQRTLLSKGYVCSPFELKFGTSQEDRYISMRPLFGNGHSKIQVMGHLATQIVILIHKPTKKLTVSQKAKYSFNYKRMYAKNLLSIKHYRMTDKTVKRILGSQRGTKQEIRLKPRRGTVAVTIKRGSSINIYIDYINHSGVPLFSLYHRLGGTKPIALATATPKDRGSEFASKNWEGVSKNRTNPGLWLKETGHYNEADYIMPGQNFSFLTTLNSNSLAKGTYVEDFAVVQEGVGWVEGSNVKLSITII